MGTEPPVQERLNGVNGQDSDDAAKRTLHLAHKMSNLMARRLKARGILHVATCVAEESSRARPHETTEAFADAALSLIEVQRLHE